MATNTLAINSDPSRTVRLRAITGPQAVDRELTPGHRHVLGRAVACDICLLDATVSREHCALVWGEGRGLLTDLRSSRGTFLNGVRIEPDTPMAVAIGDLITVGPWTFRLHPAAERTTGVHTVDDTSSADLRIERLAQAPSVDPAETKLRLLVDCIGGLNAAADETELASAAASAALNGTGFRRAAVLRGGAGDGDAIEVLASLRRDTGVEDSFSFSRSLVREAAQGHVVALSSRPGMSDGRSIMDLGIQSALCVPIHLADTVAAVLYLDSRRGDRVADAANASYCQAVARACGMAMANLKRMDLEARQRAMREELAAAREVQGVLLPLEHGRLPGVSYAFGMRPGRYVAGDLFDIFPLPDGRVAVCMGDVSGHGLGSGLVMATVQAYLHAHLISHGDPARAARDVNHYACERVLQGRFVSLWIGVLAGDGSVECVDAGHGHWVVVGQSGSASKLPVRGDIPIGIDPDREFRSEQFSLAVGDRVVLYSDGIIEQLNPRQEQFGLDRVIAALVRGGAPLGDVNAVTGSLDQFREGVQAADDATIASFSWDGRAEG